MDAESTGRVRGSSHSEKERAFLQQRVALFWKAVLLIAVCADATGFLVDPAMAQRTGAMPNRISILFFGLLWLFCRRAKGGAGPGGAAGLYTPSGMRRVVSPAWIGRTIWLRAHTAGDDTVPGVWSRRSDKAMHLPRRGWNWVEASSSSVPRFDCHRG